MVLNKGGSGNNGSDHDDGRGADLKGRNVEKEMMVMKMMVVMIRITLLMMVMILPLPADMAVMGCSVFFLFFSPLFSP